MQHRTKSPSLFCILHSAFCILFVILASTASAAPTEVWTLTTGDLNAQPVQVKGIEAGGIRVMNADGAGIERLIPMAEFVELERTLPPTPAAGKFMIHLTTGDQVGGEPIGVKNEAVAWQNPLLGETAFPFTQVRAVARPGVRVSDERRKEDVLTLTNKDVVRGTIADISATKVTLQTEGGATDIPLDSVESLIFAATPAPAGAADKPGFRVRLDDGTSIIGQSIETAGAGAQVKLTLSDGKARAIDLARVAAVEQVNGPVSWLPSRTPTEIVSFPYIGSDQRYAPRMNVNLVGDPIRFKDRIFRRGISTHSYARIVYPLDGKSYRAFRTRYAIDPAADAERVDLTVRVKLDDKVAYEQQHVRPGALSAPVVLDLGAAKTLTLEVDFGDFMDSGDRLNWIEPALLKTKPAAEPAAPPAGAAAGDVPTTRPATKPASEAPAVPTAPPAPVPDPAPPGKVEEEKK